MLVVLFALMLLFTPCVSHGFTLLATGIDTCTNAGADGCYGNGLARSYTKLGAKGVELPETTTFEDGWIMTRDNVTGLVWENKQATAVRYYQWGAANTYCDDLKLGGFSDWRLPTVNELASLIDYGGDSSSTIDPVFFPFTIASNGYSDHYWTSTLVPADTAKYYAILFTRGHVVAGRVQTLGSGVRAVRGDDMPAAPNLTDNNDGTLTDLNTGLMWKKATSSIPLSWKEALAYCETLSDNGQKWRLPNINELRTLGNYKGTISVIPQVLVSDMEGKISYWSSSCNMWDAEEAFGVNFHTGASNPTVQAGTAYVRPVTTDDSEGVDGDINQDGYLNIADVVLALRMARDEIVPDGDQLIHGDVAPLGGWRPNPDGKITIGDALLLLRGSVERADWAGRAEAK